MVPVLPAVLHMLLSRYVHESPKHLYITENKRAEAKKAVAFYQGKHASFETVENQYMKDMKVTRHESTKVNNNCHF